jgi:hypothetical protein
MPLTVGNYWTYLVVLNYGTPDTVIMEITRQISVSHEGETFLAWARTDYPCGSTRPDYEWLFWNGINGLYILGGISAVDTFVINNLELKFPAEIGDSWPVPNVKYSYSDEKFYISDTLNYSLVAKDDELQTPAGNFKCYVYKYSVKPADDVLEYWDYYEYYSIGTGLVGIIVRGQSDDRIIERYLL